MNADERGLLITPFGNSAWCPGCACCLELFLEPRQIDFDQLPQLDQHRFEVLCRRAVLIDLSLSRTRDGHALRAHDVADPVVDRWRRVYVAPSRCGVTTQSQQYLVRSLIECCGIVMQP